MKKRARRGPSRCKKCGHEIIGRACCSCEDDGRVDGVESDIIATPNDHAIEMIEKRYKGKLISIEEAQEMGFDLLIKWLRSLTRFGNIKRTMLLIKHSDERIAAKFFTGEHIYSISARLPDEYEEGYLGCIGNCRKPRVGETWTRGSDLADGRYNQETFDKIIRDIVSYEMKNLQCFRG